MVQKNTAKIKEIFSSIQGEGLCIGCKQIFVRFCSCNLNCEYCDTDFYPANINNKSDYFEFEPTELVNYLESNFNIEYHHSISLTGGEPLIWVDFLKEFMPELSSKHKVKFYLETNGTITDNAEIILPYTDIVSADIKLPSCSGIKNSFELHNNFFKTVKSVKDRLNRSFSLENGNFYAKVVFDKTITDEEIQNTIDLAKEYNIYLILQPRMIGNEFSVNSDFMMETFNKFLSGYSDVRLIPQVHKYIDVE